MSALFRPNCVRAGMVSRWAEAAKGRRPTKILARQDKEC